MTTALNMYIRTFENRKERFRLTGMCIDFANALYYASSAATEKSGSDGYFAFHNALQSYFGVTKSTTASWENAHWESQYSPSISNTLKIKVLDWCSLYIKSLSEGL